MTGDKGKCSLENARWYRIFLNNEDTFDFAVIYDGLMSLTRSSSIDSHSMRL